MKQLISLGACLLAWISGFASVNTDNASALARRVLGTASDKIVFTDISPAKAHRVPTVSPSLPMAKK